MSNLITHCQDGGVVGGGGGGELQVGVVGGMEEKGSAGVSRGVFVLRSMFLQNIQMLIFLK